MKDFILLNGNKVPALAYGTWLIKNEDAPRLVEMAIEEGYRHIDTAQAYGNEEGVGLGIKNSKIKREDIYITSKVQAEIKNYEEAKKSIDESLKKLDVDYIDLMLIHCPQPWALFRGPNKYYEENVEVWKALTEAYEEGKLKAIGVSNFLPEDIDNLINHSKYVPMVNQICIHIGCTPQDVIDYCNEKNIVVEAYSPIAHGVAVGNEEIKQMADKYGVSVAQLCIQYTLQLNTISIPKASSREHIRDNINFDFTINEEDMEILKKFKPIR